MVVLLLHLLFIFLIHSFYAEAELIPLCEGGNYTDHKSTFGSNLHLLLSNLSSSNATFTTVTKGVSPDTVYGIVLCRGDLDPSSCNSCYKSLYGNVTQLCPYSRRATVWDRECELRYSDIRFFSSLNTSEVDEGLCNTRRSTDTFANMSRELFEKTSYQAAFNSSRMFATGMLSYDETSTTIYSLAQCTMDLSRDLCSQCLNQTLETYWNYCPNQVGGWFIGKSCNYRYEEVPFYSGNATLLLNLSSPSPTPPPSLPPPTQMVSPPTSQNRGGKVV